MKTDHVLGPFPKIMGIVNVTPDSFSDGGQFFDPEHAIAHGERLIAEGADILDIGGESTRPGAVPVDPQEEMRRVVPVIEALAKKSPWISIDTRSSSVMEAAVSAGASIINDVSALSHDPRSLDVAADASVPVILMHAQGTPVDMQKNPIYNNVVGDICEWLKGRILSCETHRIDASMLIVDPGIGFGKTIEDNVLILRNIKEFHSLECPVMLGTSRKSFIGALDRDDEVQNRLGGSLSSVLWGHQNGVQIFRVHDVRETRQALKIYDEIASS